MLSHNNIKLSLVNYKFIIICLLVGIIIRFALILCLSPIPTSDASFYFSTAIKIANGYGYVDTGKGNHLTAYWPIGYSGFLSTVFWLFGPSIFVGQLANLICSVIIFLTSIGITQYIFKNKSITNCTAFLLAFYPNYIAYNTLLLSELFLTAMLILGLFLNIRFQNKMISIVTGIIYGIVILTKPQFFLVPLFIALVVFFSSKDKLFLKKVFYQFLIVYIVAILTIVPWIYRNYLVFHSFVFISTNGGANLYVGNNAQATGHYEDASLNNLSENNEVIQDHQYTAAAINYIKQNPIQFFKIFPIKMYYLWVKDGEAEYGYQTGYENYKKYYIEFRVVRAINQIYYGFLILLAFIGIFHILKNKKYQQNPLLLLGMIFCAYSSGIYAIFFGESRFHFPIMPWIIMYSSYSLVYLIETYSRKNIIKDQDSIRLT